MPWFINWDDYKTNFEQEATRILGHPVSVGGSASASILPSPSLTFTDVRVGPAGAPPMMTVDRFEVTIELMPLLQGDIHVTAMRLERPTVRIAVDDSGGIDWLARPAATEGFDPDKVVLSGVSVSDGTIAYADSRTGVAMEFAGVTAAVEARSLAGPWRAEGSYRDGETAVPFLLTTGRRLDDGTIRLKTDVSPSLWPVDVSADGVLANDAMGGVSYAGTYAVTELVENVTGEALPEGAEPISTGWRSEGAFALTGDRLFIDKAILSHGPLEQPTSVAGSLALEFGDTPSFEVSAEARQLDLDRALGGGPTQPIEVAAATDRFVDWLATLPIPDIPGRVALNVPAIVVGGSVIQDVAFSASPDPGGWAISGFRARLPGHAIISADGVLSTNSGAGFSGSARLAVAQPATFASWWRGGSNQGAGRNLSAFDISGSAEIAPGRFSVSNIQAEIGGATINGRFAWNEAQRDSRRHLGTDLNADRIDFAQLRALAELLVGRDLTDSSVLADSYSVILAADAFDLDDVHMTDVAINAEYSDDVLKIVRFAIGDLGGSSFKVTSGSIDQPTTNPRGELTAELEVQDIDGLALVAGRLFPDSGVLEWLGRTADVTTPAYVRARIVAPPEPGGTGFRIAIEDGVAGPTTFDVEIESRAALVANWRDEPARVSVVMASPDSAALARQFGLAATPSDNDGGAHVEFAAAGAPAQGMETTVIADFAGVTANAAGTMLVVDNLQPTFSGDFGVSSSSLRALIATAGLSIPGGEGETSVELDGTLDVGAGRAGLTWTNAHVADRLVSGVLVLTPGGENGWRLDGNLSLDEIDVGWLMSLGLGHAPFPTGDANEPWPRDPFSAPGYGRLSGKVAIAAERATLSETMAITGARFAVALQPQRIDLDLSEGHLAGGAAAGGMSIHNVDGNASVTGQFTLSGASLDTFSWRLDERAVATGVLDISLDLEAIGRSPAGLVSSMTGGGVVSVHDGEARYFDPTFAARQIIRASDLGQEFTDDALRISLAEQIGADALTFGEAGGAFTIAGGAVRLRGLSINAPDRVEAAGNAVVDFNTMTLDSDWTLTFDPGDTKVQGIEPKLGVVFRGPLGEPGRIIDALPFGSYLNTRREARILEIIAQEEADRAERERFARVALKLRQEAERSERLAREAAEAELIRREIQAAAGVRLEQLHIEREVFAEQRNADELGRWADWIAAISAAANENARVAAAFAVSERERADTLASEVPTLATVAKEAVATATQATNALNAAEATASHAASEVSEATRLVALAEEELRLIAEHGNSERGAIAAAEGERVEAEAALAAATAAAAAASNSAAAADTEVSAADAELAEAERSLAEVSAARDRANNALAEAKAALAELESNAETSGAQKAAAAREASSAIADRDRLREQVDTGAQNANAAVATRDAAGRAYRDAEAALVVARNALEEASQLAESLAAVVQALSAESENNPDLPSAQTTARAMELRRAARRAEVDRLIQELELARPKLQAAETAAVDALSRASMAKAALDAATTIAADATAVAEQAVMSNATLLNMLSQRTAARESAAAESAAQEQTASTASAAVAAAEERVAGIADRAKSAREAAASAEAARLAAANRVAMVAEAAEAHRRAAADAQAEWEAVAARLVEVQAALVAANAASESAASAVGTARTAVEAANTAAIVVQGALAEAEANAEAAAASALEAEAAAATAEAAADSRAIEAEAAGFRFSSGGPIDEAAAAPPVLRPRRQPINLVPEAIAGDQPMVLVPAQ